MWLKKTIQSAGLNWDGCVRGNINIFNFGPMDSLFYAPSNFKLRNSAVLYQIIGIIEL